MKEWKKPRLVLLPIKNTSDGRNGSVDFDEPGSGFSP